MTHADLDPILYNWCQKHGVHIYTQMRDDEIRGADIVDDAGDIYQMNIVPIGGPDRTVAINIWDKKKEHAEYGTSLPLLHACLDDAYKKVLEWITTRGHTRTVY